MNNQELYILIQDIYKRLNELESQLCGAKKRLDAIERKLWGLTMDEACCEPKDSKREADYKNCGAYGEYVNEPKREADIYPLSHCCQQCEDFHKKVIKDAESKSQGCVHFKFCTDFEKVREPKREPEYSNNGEYGKDDPEVTCWHCGKTFKCDPMDACCRLCSAPFAKERCKEFGFIPKEKDEKN